jgi:small-conductance mechanosensitive channel
VTEPSFSGRRRWHLLGPLLLLAALQPALAVAAPTPAGQPAELRLRDAHVLTLQAARGGKSAVERARESTQSLATALEEDPGSSAVVELLRGDTAVVRVGRVAVLDLGPEDVAASGTPGIAELAQASAAQIDQALRAERRRARIAEVVFHVSLLVLSGLVAWLVVRKIGDLDRRVEGAIRERSRGVPALRFRSVELVSPEGVAGAVAIAVKIGRILLQVAIAWGWLIFALSLFPATRGTGVRLGQVVLGPAAGTLARIGSALPALIGAITVGALLWLVLRAVRLFFHSAAVGETHLRWLPAELAVPVGQLVRIAVVVIAAVFAAPVLTGSEDGVLANVGTAALVALALAAAPALASVAAGLPRLFSRTYRTGHVAEVGSSSGIVRAVGLLDLELEDASGRRVLVPHLAALFSPTRLPGLAAAARFELAVDPNEDQGLVREILLRTGGPGTSADLVRLDAGAATYRIAGAGADLAVRVSSALRAEGVKLGRPQAGMVVAP